MARNFGHTDTFSHAKERSVRLNVSNLKAGDKLVRLIYPRWGEGEIQIHEYVVVKALKTRLVITPATAVVREIRILVEGGTWRTGDVKTEAERGSSYDHVELWNLATPDDSIVAEARQHNERDGLKKDATRKVRELLESTWNMDDLDKVNAAIQALQVQADSIRAKITGDE